MRVLICDDHRLFGEALAVVLASRGHEVVGCTTDPVEAAAVAHTTAVDVCVMDLRFPGHCGVTGTGLIFDASPTTRVVILTGSDDPDRLRRAIDAGAHGVVVKEDDVGRVVDTIERVHAGDLVLPGHIVRAGAVRTGSALDRHALGRFLTNREKEVLVHLVRGESTADLARALGVRYSTARTHIQNTLTKLGVHSKLEAVAYAVSQDLVPVPKHPPDGR